MAERAAHNRLVAGSSPAGPIYIVSRGAPMVWQERIAAAFSRLTPTDSALVPSFYPPATQADVAELETKLNVVQPNDLAALLAETNGVGELLRMAHHNDVMIGYFIWPIQKIVEENLRFRTVLGPLYRREPFDELLFFADAGNGDQFGCRIENGRVAALAIYVWDHEDDSRTPLANSLEEFVSLTTTHSMKG